MNKKYFFSYKRLFLNIFIILLLCISIVLELTIFNNVKFNSDINTILGVLIGITSGFLICVITVSSIWISIQNQKVFGIRISEWKGVIANKQTYSLIWMIVISALISILSIIYLIFNLRISCIVTCIIACCYAFVFAYQETPYLIRNEKTNKKLFNYVKRVLFENLNDDKSYPLESTKTLLLDKILRHLLFTDQINNIYNKFSFDLDDDKKRLLISRLLQIQYDELSKFSSKPLEIVNAEMNEYDKNITLTSIYDTSIGNIISIFKFNQEFDVIKIYDVQENEQSKCRFPSHFLFQSILLMKDSPSTCIKFDEYFHKFVQSIFNTLWFDYKRLNDKHIHLIFSFVMNLVTWSIYCNETYVLSEIRKQLSTFIYSIGDNENISNLFSTINWYLCYVIKNSYYNVKTKKLIENFIEEQSGVDDNNEGHHSWSVLFFEFVYPKENLTKLQSLLDIYEHCNIMWEHIPTGIVFVRNISLSKEFVIDWYLEMKVNNARIDYDIDKDLQSLKKFHKLEVAQTINSRWISKNKDKNTIVKKEFKISALHRFDYDKVEDWMPYVDSFEKYRDKEFKNKIINDSLKINSQINCELIKTKLIENVSTQLNKIQNLNKKISLKNNSKKQFYMMYLQSPYIVIKSSIEEEVAKLYGDTFYESIKREMQKQIDEKSSIQILNFKNAINKILEFGPTYKNNDLLQLVFYKGTEQQVLEAKDILNKIKIIENDFLVRKFNTFYKGLPYEFNYETDSEHTEINLADDDFVNKYIDENHKREDGQYFYRYGDYEVLMERNEIFNMLKEKIILIRFVFSYEIKIYEKNILYLKIVNEKAEKTNV